MQLFINVPVSCIKTVVTDHFKIFLGDMLHEQLNEVNSRNCSFYINVVFMPVIVKRNGIVFFVITVNTTGGNHGTTEVTANIFRNNIGIRQRRLGVYIEAFIMSLVHFRLFPFEGRADVMFHFIQENSTKRIAEKRIVKMRELSPETIIGITAFGNKTMNMGIPFEGSAKGMKNTDKAGCKISGFV